MNYDLAIESLMQHFASERYTDEVTQAKREFFEQAGILDESSNDFEMKMSQFVDWYLFTRRLKNLNVRPIDLALMNNGFSISLMDRPVFEALRNSLHSLFEFLKLKGDDVYIRDVFTNSKYILKQSALTAGFNRDELFEARLIPHEDTYVFSRSFCFHPHSVMKIILKHVKKVAKLPDGEREEAKEALLMRLFKMRYKHEQYRHVDVRMIYNSDPKLRI